MKFLSHLGKVAICLLLPFALSSHASPVEVRGFEAAVEAAGGSKHLTYRDHRPLSKGARTQFWFSVLVTGSKSSTNCGLTGEVQYRPAAKPATMEVALPESKFDYVQFTPWEGDCVLMEQTVLQRVNEASGVLLERVVFGRIVNLGPKAVASGEVAEAVSAPGVLMPPLPGEAVAPPVGLAKDRSVARPKPSAARAVNPGTKKPSLKSTQASPVETAPLIEPGEGVVQSEAEAVMSAVPPPPPRTQVLKPKKFCTSEDSTGIAYSRHGAVINGSSEFGSDTVTRPEPGTPLVVGCSVRAGWRAVYPTVGGAEVIGWIRSGFLETQSLPRRE